MCECAKSQISKAAIHLANEFNQRPPYPYKDEDVERDIMEFMSCLKQNVKEGYMEWTSARKIHNLLKDAGKGYERWHSDNILVNLAKSKKIKQNIVGNYLVYKPM